MSANGTTRRRRIATFLAVIVAMSVALIYGPVVGIGLIGGHDYVTPSRSMAPALMQGDWFLALPIGDGLPTRGTVAVYRRPDRPDIDYVKRLIAFAGETVQLRGGVVYIDGQPAAMERLADRVVPMRRQGTPPALPRCRNWAPSTGDCVQEQWRETLPDGTSQIVLNVAGDIGAEPPSGQPGPDDTPVVTVPAGHVFVLGDNRDNSVDSRFHGTVPVADLRHRVWMIHSSFDRSAAIPHPRWGRFFRMVH